MLFLCIWWNKHSMGTLTKVMWCCLYQFDMLKLVLPLLNLEPPSLNLFLLPNTLMSFLCSIRAIHSVKYRQKLVCGRVLWVELVRNGRETKGTILEASLQNFLILTKSQLFGKSPLAGVIMQFKPHNSSTVSSPVLFILRQSKMSWKKQVST